MLIIASPKTALRRYFGWVRSMRLSQSKQPSNVSALMAANDTQ